MTDVILDRLQAELARQGARALVAVSPENVTYTAGHLVPSHPTNRHRRTISVLAGDGRGALVVVSVEAELARQHSRLKDVRGYDQFTQNAMDVLADLLRELGVAEGPVALEMDYLPAQDYLRLCERLPSLAVVPCREIYQRARMVKIPLEIGWLRKIADISDRAEQAVWRRVRDGMSEKALAAVITTAVLEGGGDGVRILIGSGERSAIVDPQPSDRVVRRGDVIRIEILGALKNYQSKVTRTGILGRATDEQRRTWAMLMAGRARVLQRLRPGVAARDLWSAYADHCRRQSLEPTLGFLGHGIGLTGHEEPYLTAGRDVALEPGMVVTLEPFSMMPPHVGFHIGDMFLITPNGYENLTTVMTNETLIEVG